MRQTEIIVIHGGGSYSSDAAFLAALKVRPIHDPLADSPKRWKHTLRAKLGDGYDVYLPSMPNSDNARYNEWKIWFERHLELVHDGVILIGHSLGGYFLAKYLAEETMVPRPGAVFLLAAPYNADGLGAEDCASFAFDPEKLAAGAAQARHVYILHSTDDPVVAYSHAEQYAALLPDATLVTCTGKGHFLMESFPELIGRIRECARL